MRLTAGALVGGGIGVGSFKSINGIGRVKLIETGIKQSSLVRWLVGLAGLVFSLLHDDH